MQQDKVLRPAGNIWQHKRGAQMGKRPKPVHKIHKLQTIRQPRRMKEYSITERDHSISAPTCSSH